MVETLPSLGSAALPKPMVAVIGDFQDMPGPIESCKARLEFVFLNAIPEEPDFWSRSQIKGVVFCGLKWFPRFRETEGFDELGIVVAVNDLNEFSAALEAGASTLLIKPLSGNALLRQIENQLHIVGQRKRSEQLLSGQKKVLEMIARGTADLLSNLRGVGPIGCRLRQGRTVASRAAESDGGEAGARAAGRVYAVVP